MSLKSALSDVVKLQPSWSAENTGAMQRRGSLVRDEVPRLLKSHLPTFAAALGNRASELAVEGSDGTGLKAHVPWVRIFSTEKAPSAQSGWYCVYLFHPNGSGVSLCLSHGSTTWNGGAMTVRTAEEAENLISWARAITGPIFGDNREIKAGVRLGANEKLAQAYEQTTAYSRFYPAAEIPNDLELLADTQVFLSVLKRLYDAEDLGQSPESISPEVEALEKQAEIISNPLKLGKPPPPGQGRGLSPGERKLVELHAMGVARQWLKDNDYEFNDVSLSKPFDFEASKNGRVYIVEVKGTTGTGESILLTKNEVAAHRSWFPDNLLIVISEITLSDDRTRPSGGRVRVVAPWQIEASELIAITYECRLL